jgi:hypothetical protein
MPSASCIFIEVSILTIQPVENIGDVLHDENVLKSTCIVLPTKLNIYAFGFMYITGTRKK